MSENEVLATLTSKEIKQLFRIYAEKEAAKIMIESIQARLSANIVAEQEFFGEIRKKYEIPDGTIYYNQKTQTIHRGSAKGED